MDLLVAVCKKAVEEGVMMIKRVKGSHGMIYVPKKKYAVIYGTSVYYPHQDDYTWTREFDTKKKASVFLKKVNKRKNIDFSDFVSRKKQLEKVV